MQSIFVIATLAVAAFAAPHGEGPRRGGDVTKTTTTTTNEKNSADVKDSCNQNGGKILCCNAEQFQKISAEQEGRTKRAGGQGLPLDLEAIFGMIGQDATQKNCEDAKNGVCSSDQMQGLCVGSALNNNDVNLDLGDAAAAEE